jgi:DNA-binding transcriptional MerR regulator
LSIGRFADATGLTVKALHHYDEIGLLVPARVDPDNGYRYYDAAQVEEAVTIRPCRAPHAVSEITRPRTTASRPGT